MYNINNKTKNIANMGLMLAMVLALTALEQTVAALLLLPPGVKLGLSNIIVMYTIFFLGKRPALLLALLKSLFVMITRGAVAGAPSLCGGLLSIVAIIILSRLGKGDISYLILSVTGAIFHNFGQIIAASFILKSNYAFGYLPVLIVSGIVAGSVTGVLLRVTMPVFDRIWKR